MFYKVNTLLLHQSNLKRPTSSQINLIENAKKHFLLLKQLKNTSSAQLCLRVPANLPEFFFAMLQKTKKPDVLVLSDAVTQKCPSRVSLQSRNLESPIFGICNLQSPQINYFS